MCSKTWNIKNKIQLLGSNATPRITKKFCWLQAFRSHIKQDNGRSHVLKTWCFIRITLAMQATKARFSHNSDAIRKTSSKCWKVLSFWIMFSSLDDVSGLTAVNVSSSRKPSPSSSIITFDCVSSSLSSCAFLFFGIVFDVLQSQYGIYLGSARKLALPDVFLFLGSACMLAVSLTSKANIHWAQMAEMNMKYSVLAVYFKSITALNCVLEMSQEKVYCISSIVSITKTAHQWPCS